MPCCSTSWRVRFALLFFCFRNDSERTFRIAVLGVWFLIVPFWSACYAGGIHEQSSLTDLASNMRAEFTKRLEYVFFPPVPLRGLPRKRRASPRLYRPARPRAKLTRPSAKKRRICATASTSTLGRRRRRQPVRAECRTSCVPSKWSACWNPRLHQTRN